MRQQPRVPHNGAHVSHNLNAKTFSSMNEIVLFSQIILHISNTDNTMNVICTIFDKIYALKLEKSTYIW